MDTGHFPFGRMLFLLVGIWGLFMVFDALRTRKGEEQWEVLCQCDGSPAWDWLPVGVYGLSAGLLLGLVVADILGVIHL